MGTPGEQSTIQHKESAKDILDRKLTDERDYEFFKASGSVWITNGRGLVSRLWLDYSVGIFTCAVIVSVSSVVLYRRLDFFYPDDGGVQLYNPRERDSASKRQAENEPDVYPIKQPRVELNLFC